MSEQTYATAGVNVGKAEAFVERLKKQAKRKGHEKLWPAAGSYATVYPTARDRGIAVTTDGVGTKLLISQKLQKYDTIGIDLVAMCANDLICVGARPTLFLDYFATGKLEDAAADAIIGGIIKGCDEAGMILAGGETAEMPGVYEPGHYDLAGFAIGELSREELITGEKIEPGHVLIGIASSGIHSNGLSLARKVLPDDEKTLSQLLQPTLIYAKFTNNVFNELPNAVTGIAHITGGGWRNLFRLNKNVGYRITEPLPVPNILLEISKQVAADEMYRTFNMGMGLAVIVPKPHAEEICKIGTSAGFTTQVVGEVTNDPEVLTIEGTSIKLKG